MGARLYGIRTTETFSADEENKVGSEYEIFDIDHEFRKRPKDYKKLVKKICVTKLKHAGIIASLDSTSPNYIDNYFEKFDQIKLQKRLQSKSDKVSRSYFLKLERQLSTFKIKSKEIIELLTFDENRILERTNVFLFYRDWNSKKNENLMDTAKAINLHRQLSA